MLTTHLCLVVNVRQTKAVNSTRSKLYWTVALILQHLYRLVSFYARVTFLKNIRQTEHKIPIYSNVFPGG
jgi:hypothetical protein